MKTRRGFNPVYGRCISTVTHDQRIRIGNPILPLLQAQDVRQLWLCTIPGKGALMVCPHVSWNRWIQKMQSEFPVLRSPEGLRPYLTLSDQVGLESKGRIFVAQRLLMYAELKAGDVVEVFGMGEYLEIWKARPSG